MTKTFFPSRPLLLLQFELSSLALLFISNFLVSSPSARSLLLHLLFLFPRRLSSPASSFFPALPSSYASSFFRAPFFFTRLLFLSRSLLLHTHFLLLHSLPSFSPSSSIFTRLVNLHSSSATSLSTRFLLLHPPPPPSSASFFSTRILFLLPFSYRRSYSYCLSFGHLLPLATKITVHCYDFITVNIFRLYYVINTHVHYK